MTELQNTTLSPAVRAFMERTGTASPDIFPVSAAMNRRAREAEEARLQAEKDIDDALNGSSEPSHLIGRELGDRGIYLGRYAPVDREGNSLGKVFNAFAAPEDLTNADGNRATFQYTAAVKRIAALEDWHGHDGTNYATDKEIYEALRDGSYNGGWIIPTGDLLVGKDVDGKETTPGNLYAHKLKGALRGTFTTAAWNDFSYPHWYWSSTENRDNSSFANIVRFSDGLLSRFRQDDSLLSCRPVRLEAVAQGGPHG